MVPLLVLEGKADFDVHIPLVVGPVALADDDRFRVARQRGDVGLGAHRAVVVAAAEGEAAVAVAGEGVVPDSGDAQQVQDLFAGECRFWGGHCGILSIWRWGRSPGPTACAVPQGGASYSSSSSVRSGRGWRSLKVRIHSASHCVASCWSNPNSSIRYGLAQIGRA